MKPLRQNESTIDDLTDEEVIKLIAKIDAEKDYVGKKFTGVSPAVYRLTSDTVAKPLWQSECEGFTMQYVSAHTDIPVPRVLRTVEFDGSSWMIMSYIEGETLDDVWPKSSIWRKISIILTLRRYIRQLHNVPLPSPSRKDIPGPFDGSTGRDADICNPYHCYGCCFSAENGGGPFPTYRALTDYMNRKLSVALNHDKDFDRKLRPGDDSLTFDDSFPLVLIHGDLHMQNIILSKSDGKLYLLDWGFSGAYPEWLEYCGIKLLFGDNTPWLWRNYEHIPFT